MLLSLSFLMLKNVCSNPNLLDIVFPEYLQCRIFHVAFLAVQSCIIRRKLSQSAATIIADALTSTGHLTLSLPRTVSSSLVFRSVFTLMPYKSKSSSGFPQNFGILASCLSASSQSLSIEFVLDWSHTPCVT